MNPDRATPTPSLRDLVAERWDGNGTAVEAIEIVEHHGATVTVTLLVCTHRRFERCARTLMRDLAASGRRTLSSASGAGTTSRPANARQVRP